MHKSLAEAVLSAGKVRRPVVGRALIMAVVLAGSGWAA
jgi:hypothetical protein